MHVHARAKDNMRQNQTGQNKKNIHSTCTLCVGVRSAHRTCMRLLCEYWYYPECQCQKNESGCKAGDKCLFPHHEFDEQPNKKPKKSDHSQKRRESDDKNAVAIVKIVSQMGCASQDSELLDSQRGKQAREKSWDRFEEYDSLSLRYVKQVSGKRKDHRLEKYKSKILTSEVHTL